MLSKYWVFVGFPKDARDSPVQFLIVGIGNSFQKFDVFCVHLKNIYFNIFGKTFKAWMFFKKLLKNPAFLCFIFDRLKATLTVRAMALLID